MLLVIEQGNTNTKFAVHDGKEWRAQWRTATYASRTADENAVWLDQLCRFSGLSFEQLNACIISSVVPQSLFHLRNFARRYLNTEPVVVGENAELGIEVRIERPTDAGSDRLIDAIGAFIEYGGPLIVVDSGTATTFDIVAKDGAFEGGIISPGINLSMEALHNAAARLPRIAIMRPEKVIGANTVGAMQSGLFWGYISLIDGLCARIEDEYGEKMTVVATGGVASLFEGASESIHHYDQDVPLRGLLEVYRRTVAAK